MTRRATAAALLGVALSLAAPSHAQIRRPAQRAAKKRIAPRRPQARRQGSGAEDFIMRLVQQPPARRKQMLANNRRFQNLPSSQRKRILARIEEIDKMQPEERAQLIERYNLFSRLAPEQRENARALYQQWVNVPASKRQLMTRAITRLRRLDPARRPAVLESPAMTQRFNDEERKLIGQIAEIAPGPVGSR